MKRGRLFGVLSVLCSLLVGLALVLLPVNASALSISPDATIGTNASVTCSTTATLLLSANAKRRSFLILAPPTNTVTVYVGFSSGVTTSNGIPLNASNNLSDNTYVGAVYCIVASGTAPLIAGETKR